MTKQTSTSKQPAHIFPENIKKSLEEFWEPITSADYCGDLAIEDGGRVVCVPTFVVNKTHYVYVHDATKGYYQYEPIISRQERQRKFVENVRSLMNAHGLSWKLGKVIVEAYPNDTAFRTSLCVALQEAKSDIYFDCMKSKKMSYSESERAMHTVILRHSIYNWLDTHNRRVHNALKDYLFANC